MPDTKKMIEVPMLEKGKQIRFERWLTDRGNTFARQRSIHAVTFMVQAKDEQDAFWIGANHTAISYGLFDGPLTTTLG